MLVKHSVMLGLVGFVAAFVAGVASPALALSCAALAVAALIGIAVTDRARLAEPAEPMRVVDVFTPAVPLVIDDTNAWRHGVRAFHAVQPAPREPFAQLAQLMPSHIEVS